MELRIAHLCNFSITSLTPFIRDVMVVVPEDMASMCSFVKLGLADTFKFSHFMARRLIRITLSALAAPLAFIHLFPLLGEISTLPL